MPSNTQIIVLLKAPRLGLPKTRLAAQIGAPAALEAYRAVVSRLLGGIAAMRTVQLRHTPDDAGGDCEEWLRPGWTLRPQGSGNLGERMLSAFESSRAEGFPKTILIGADCPYLDEVDLHEAATLLDEIELVLGPATDGGYWLIGLKQPEPYLFAGIEWGTGRVLDQTLHAAKHLGISHRLLRTLSDIDTPDDWHAFQCTIRATRH